MLFLRKTLWFGYKASSVSSWWIVHFHRRCSNLGRFMVLIESSASGERFLPTVTFLSMMIKLARERKAILVLLACLCSWWLIILLEQGFDVYLMLHTLHLRLVNGEWSLLSISSFLLIEKLIWGLPVANKWTHCDLRSNREYRSRVVRKLTLLSLSEALELFKIQRNCIISIPLTLT